MQQLLGKVKEEIKQLLKLAQQVHITCDIWSKKGMSESFLDIIVHFFAKQQRQHATLAVRNIHSSHTALNNLSILKEVMMEWSIPKEAISKVITNNGSNMFKAFQIFQNMTNEEQPATVEINDDDPIVVDSEDEDEQKEQKLMRMMTMMNLMMMN